MTPTDAVVLRLDTAEKTARWFYRHGGRIPDGITKAFGRMSVSHLREAELFTWRQDLLKAAISASATLPSPVTLTPELRPCDHGLYLFDQDVLFDGCAKPICAVGWVTMAEYTSCLVYIRTAGTTWSDVGAFAPYANFVVQNGSVATATGDGSVDLRTVTTESEFSMERGGEAVMRFLLSSWLWLKQRVMSVTPTPANRAARKLAARADISGSVNVVVLRRSESGHREGSDTDVEWSCRWLVRGHWRQQYYRSTGEHRPVWIEPYVKGPDDKPLKAPTETVFAVQR